MTYASIGSGGGKVIYYISAIWIQGRVGKFLKSTSLLHPIKCRIMDYYNECDNPFRMNGTDRFRSSVLPDWQALFRMTSSRESLHSVLSFFKISRPLPSPHLPFPFLSLAHLVLAYPSFCRILMKFRMRWSPNGIWLRLG